MMYASETTCDPYTRFTIKNKKTLKKEIRIPTG